MQPRSDVVVKLQAFVLKEFPLARRETLDAAEPLLESGAIDSLGVLQLVAFIEQEFDIRFSEQDMVSAVFESLDSLSAFVEKQRGADSATAG